jgi:hypothetical protein
MELSRQQTSQLKAIAILMMLFMHLFQRDYHGLFEPLVFLWGQPLSYYFALFSDACVPIFCFVSGYGLYFKYQNRSQMYVKSNIKRIIKLYINYWIILLLFAVGLGLYLGKTEYIGGFQKFALNFLALDTSYNGAWWFFFTYIVLVITSPFFFKILKKRSSYILLIAALLFYVPAFYFRIYKPNIFDFGFLNYLQKQIALFGTSFLPFIAGAAALKGRWNSRIHTYNTNTIHKKHIIACGNHLVDSDAPACSEFYNIAVYGNTIHIHLCTNGFTQMVKSSFRLFCASCNKFMADTHVFLHNIFPRFYLQSQICAADFRFADNLLFGKFVYCKSDI